ncbi:large ribosomal subunit protein mL53-like isoform X1 [Cloeon dipterum]|uniref:large ribosomal subunit protein mL53-like isoform X1 n=1 Tax=Cloeon dipterum TaxID=197152 RepID=UPI0032203393
MSIFASGSLKRSAGVIDAIRKQVKLVTLKPAKRIVIKFDPFHDKAPETRKFLLHITNPKIQDTNLNCLVKAEVLCDLSDPSVEVHLNEGGKVTVKSSNLSCLEILKLYNKYVTPLAPVEEATNVVKTKAAKTSHQLASKKKR